MSIIDPNTGMPTERQFNISPQDLIKVLTAQRVKIDMLNQQNMQLGLYVEFVVEHLMSMTGADGNPLLDIDINDFQAFAERRLKEIQNEVAEHQAKAATEEADQVLSQLPEGMGTEIQLNE